jgi:hypothetical protein
MERHQNRFLDVKKMIMVHSIQATDTENGSSLNIATWDDRKYVHCSKWFEIFYCQHML